MDAVIYFARGSEICDVAAAGNGFRILGALAVSTAISLGTAAAFYCGTGLPRGLETLISVHLALLMPVLCGHLARWSLGECLPNCSYCIAGAIAFAVFVAGLANSKQKEA